MLFKVKGRTDKFNNIKSVWKNIYIILFKLVIAFITKIKGEYVLREIFAIYITEGYYLLHAKKNFVRNKSNTMECKGQKKSF